MEAKIENFELRSNQMYVRDALALSIEDMIKEQPKDRHTLSRADIILIFTVYGSLDVFFRKYQQYVVDCERSEYIYCQPPHYYLKYQIG